MATYTPGQSSDVDTGDGTCTVIVELCPIDLTTVISVRVHEDIEEAKEDFAQMMHDESPGEMQLWGLNALGNLLQAAKAAP